MPTRESARGSRSLLQAKVATVVVRVSAAFCLLAAVCATLVDGIQAVSVICGIVGGTALSQPLLLSCLYTRSPDTLPSWKLSCGKVVLYIWLFLLNCVMVAFIGYGLVYLVAFHELMGYILASWQGLLMMLVFFTCLALAIINIYTFCLLYSHGSCFMHALQRNAADVLNDVTPVAIFVPTSTVMFIAQKPEVGGATSGMDFSDAPPPYTEQCPPYTETVAEK